jgi:hypothetical protein
MSAQLKLFKSIARNCPCGRAMKARRIICWYCWSAAAEDHEQRQCIADMRGADHLARRKAVRSLLEFARTRAQKVTEDTIVGHNLHD